MQSLFKEYLFRQFDQALECIPEVGPDKDSEYLHCFRVAIRRIRSLIRLYIPDHYVFNDALKSLTEPSNELRELDIFLESLDPAAYPVLHKKISNYRNRRYKKIWDASLKTYLTYKLGFLKNELGDTDLHTVAHTMVNAAHIHFNDTFTAFGRLEQSHSEKKMHKLRIQFKILRYALEFLHESGIEEHHDDIKRCKAIQNRLGLIQDASDQLKWLQRFCESNPCDECHTLLLERKKSLHSLKKKITVGAHS
jgi:CHAD domain-containing protein